MAARDAERERLAADVAAWQARGGVIEKLSPGQSGCFDATMFFNPSMFEADDEKLPAIATVDGVEA